jgi:hypothetical protein
MDFKGLLNNARVNFPAFNELYFKYLLEIEEKGLPLDKASDLNLTIAVDTSIHDELVTVLQPYLMR